MRRKFSATFKAEVVRDLLTGKHSAAELCREHQLSSSLLSLWKESALEHLQLLFQAEERAPSHAATPHHSCDSSDVRIAADGSAERGSPCRV
jgi:transposase-like protein